MTTQQDLYYMQMALDLAKEAEKQDEVPVGAVVVRGGEVIATAFNQRENGKCATHHAEILAIEKACRNAGGWRLTDTTVYVTLEPCPMCAGALLNARVDRVVFGAYDKRAGAMGTVTDLTQIPFFHKPQIVGGIMEETCASLLSTYFRNKRKKTEV